jgi:acyl-CoA reductase-like NAD-dependent aldehyde dehydrogenase
LVLETRLFIGGNAVPASDEATFDRRDPATNLVATRASAASVGDAVRAANAAAAAFPEWSQSASEDRSRILSKAADLLSGRVEDFVNAMAEEIGASKSWAQFNCHLATLILQHAATMTDRLTSTDIPAKHPGVRAMAVRQPVGVVLSIAPWNAPVVLGVRALAVPLACANTVVFKASELCPKTHSLIVDILSDAGIPDGVVNLVTNAPERAPEIAEALVAHDAIRRVNFTGSTRVGRGVAELCARHLKPCLLELSGKAPLLVLDDADIDEAVKAAAFGAFFNQGQVCISTERIVVDDKVADEFLEKLQLKMATLEAGDPRTGSYPLGAMISREAALRVKGLVEDAVAKGAHLIGTFQLEDIIMQPVLLDGVTSAMRIYGEESFGPVAAVIRVESVEEAISVANDTEFGLAAAVFGRDTERALDVARQIESGICHVNGPTIYDEPQMPFGGVKASGYGRFGGEAGIAEFTELRWISVHDQPHEFPI